MQLCVVGRLDKIDMIKVNSPNVGKLGSNIFKVVAQVLTNGLPAVLTFLMNVSRIRLISVRITTRLKSNVSLN